MIFCVAAQIISSHYPLLFFLFLVFLFSVFWSNVVYSRVSVGEPSPASSVCGPHAISPSSVLASDRSTYAVGGPQGLNPNELHRGRTPSHVISSIDDPLLLLWERNSWRILLLHSLTYLTSCPPSLDTRFFFLTPHPISPLGRWASKSLNPGSGLSEHSMMSKAVSAPPFFPPLYQWRTRPLIIPDELYETINVTGVFG